MPRVPQALKGALASITIVSGHYGSGKTNLTVNLALDLKADGVDVTVVDLDIVNPYFRASEQRTVFEEAGIVLVAPVFSEAGTGLDVPSLTGAIAPALEGASKDHLVLIDLGGDDAGAASIGRFSKLVAETDYAMLYVLNRHRNLMVDPEEALANLREIEAVTRLEASALVDNSHLKLETALGDILDEERYADTVSELTGLPVVAKSVPEELLDKADNQFVINEYGSLVYPIRLYVKNPWE